MGVHGLSFRLHVCDAFRFKSSTLLFLSVCIFLRSLYYPKKKLRLVVASDGTDDEANEIVTAYADRRVTLLLLPTRRGKAACLNAVMANCNEDMIVLMDARQRIDLFESVSRRAKSDVAR